MGKSLPVIALDSTAGLVGHLRQGEAPGGPTAAFTAGAALGGVRLAGLLDPTRLRRASAVFVILVGLVLLLKNAVPR